MAAAASAGITPARRLRLGERRLEGEHRGELGLRAEQRRDLGVADEAGEPGVIEGGDHQTSKNTVSPLALQPDVEAVDRLAVAHLAGGDQRRAPVGVLDQVQHRVRWRSPRPRRRSTSGC